MNRSAAMTLRLLAPWIILGAYAAVAAEEVPLVAPEDFAILPWGTTAGDRETLEGIRQCGFNLAGFVAPENVALVGEVGLKCIVHDGSTHVGEAEAQLPADEIARRVEAALKRIGEPKAVFGYYLRDEPGANLLPGLRKWADAFRLADPKGLVYINLFPNYATPGQLNVPSYAEYLEAYVKTVEPRFISYDHYALMDDGSLRDGYFQNLQSVREAAHRHGLPFWNIVLGNAHFRYAEPTAAGLRFQLYTTLAYGARGISYFTYFTPTSGNYRLGAVDQFGHKTPTWDMLRNVNLQVHRLAPAYVKLKSVHVFHHPNVPTGCSGMATSRYLAHLAGDDLLVGEFQGPDQRPHVLVVNKSLHHSTAFDLRFKQPGQVQFVSAYTGRTAAWSGENNWLAAGQGMLLLLDGK
jgi:hypothetical protein